MEQKNVFISYKTEEFDQALWVKNALEQNGISCWMAPMCIQGGSSYAEEIPAAIRQCKAFVLILSEKAQESKWVPRELDQAINGNKVVLPFMLEECPLKDDFSFYLTNVQRYEAFRDMDGTLAQLIRDLQALLGIQPPKPAVAEAPAAPEAPATAEAPAEVPAVTEPAPQPAKHKTPARKERSDKPKKVAIVCGLLALILVLAILTPLILFPNTVVIAGTEFERGVYSIRLEDVTITQEDLDKLSEFEHLANIYLLRCTIVPQDLHQVNALNLSTLEATDCQLNDTQLNSLDFSGMTHLTVLKLSGNSALTDFSALQTCQNTLEWLEISDIPITDFQWLTGFTKLTTLKANRTGMASLEPLTAMIYLRELELSGNGITSLAGLENTSKLAQVDLSNNALTDVSVLERSKASLTRLILNDNQLTDLSCLAGATGLLRVFVDNNQLTSLDWLKNCAELRVLSASDNQIGSITGLGIGTKLTYVDLSNNQLQTITQEDLVFTSANTVYMDLRNNQISTLSLSAAGSYRQLALLGNPLTDITCVQGLNGSYLYIDFPADVTVETLSQLGFTYLRIVGCPLDRQVEIEDAMRYSAQLMTVEEADAVIDEAFTKALT